MYTLRNVSPFRRELPNNRLQSSLTILSFVFVFMLFVPLVDSQTVTGSAAAPPPGTTPPAATGTATGAPKLVTATARPGSGVPTGVTNIGSIQPKATIEPTSDSMMAIPYNTLFDNETITNTTTTSNGTTTAAALEMAAQSNVKSGSVVTVDVTFNVASVDLMGDDVAEKLTSSFRRYVKEVVNKLAGGPDVARPAPSNQTTTAPPTTPEINVPLKNVTVSQNETSAPRNVTIGGNATEATNDMNNATSIQTPPPPANASHANATGIPNATTPNNNINNETLYGNTSTATPAMLPPLNETSPTNATEITVGPSVNVTMPTGSSNTTTTPDNTTTTTTSNEENSSQNFTTLFTNTTATADDIPTNEKVPNATYAVPEESSSSGDLAMNTTNLFVNQSNSEAAPAVPTVENPTVTYPANASVVAPAAVLVEEEEDKKQAANDTAAPGGDNQTTAVAALPVEAPQRFRFLQQHYDRRKLEVTLDDASIVVTNLYPCPSSSTSFASCQTLEGSYEVYVTDDEDPAYVEEVYTNETEYGFLSGTFANIVFEDDPSNGGWIFALATTTTTSTTAPAAVNTTTTNAQPNNTDSEPEGNTTRDVDDSDGAYDEETASGAGKLLLLFANVVFWGMGTGFLCVGCCCGCVIGYCAAARSRSDGNRSGKTFDEEDDEGLNAAKTEDFKDEEDPNNDNQQHAQNFDGANQDYVEEHGIRNNEDENNNQDHTETSAFGKMKMDEDTTGGDDNDDDNNAFGNTNDGFGTTNAFESASMSGSNRGGGSISGSNRGSIAEGENPYLSSSIRSSNRQEDPFAANDEAMAGSFRGSMNGSIRGKEDDHPLV